MTNQEFQEHSEALIDKAIADLMKHFDDVQIFVTRLDDGVTMACTRGAGNYYARVGHIGEWMNQPTETLEDEEE